MKRLFVLLAALWLAVLPTTQTLADSRSVALMSTQADAYPDAAVALDFVGETTNGRPFLKVGGVKTSSFKALPGATVTRASVGYAETRGGQLLLFGQDEPRITDKGLLVEEARTNLLLESQEFNSAVWSKIAGGTGSVPTVTANAAVAPDGTLTADRIGFNAGTGTTDADRSVVRQTVTVVAGTANAGAIYLKGTAGGQLVLRHAAGVDYQLITLTGDWQRVTRVETASGTSAQFEFGIRQDIGHGTINSAITVDVWQADLQAGAFITSPIRTGGATATRAADSVSIGGLSVASPVTLYTEHILAAVPAQTSYWAQVDDGSLNNRIATFSSSTGFGRANITTAGVVEMDSAATTLQAGLNKHAVRSLANDGRHALNGSLSAQDTAVNTPGPLSTFRLGAFGAGGYANAYLRRAVLYPRAFSDAELQAATRTDTSTLRFDFAGGAYRIGPNTVAPTTCFTCLPGVSVTRASVGYAERLDGSLVLFGSNIPRITDKGLLVEEARTNKATNTNVNPQNLTNVSYSGDPAGILSVVDDSAELARIGLTGNVYKIDNSAGTVNASAVFVGQAGNTNPHTTSVYWRGTGTGRQGNTANFGASEPLPATYTRSVKTQAVDTANRQMGVSAGPGSVVYFILNQFEEGSFATSPIPINGAAATRAADNVSLVGQSLSPAALTLLAQASQVSGTPGAAARLARLYDGTLDLGLTYRSDVARMAVVGSGLVSTDIGGTISAGATMTGAASLSAGSVRASANGSSAGAVGGSSTLGTITSLTLGSTGSASFVNGYLRGVALYPYAANDNELQYRSAGNW